jgi:hypothetical protein
MNELNDITFITPVKIDSQERMNNINFCVHYVLKRLKAARHIVIEQDIFQNVRTVVKTVGYDLIRDEKNYGFFYKTKLLNTAIAAVNTPFLCIYDADVYIPEGALIASVNQLRKFESVNFIIPHTGLFIDIPNSFSRDLNFKIDKLMPSDLKTLHTQSPGGAFMARTSTMRAIHGYNENIKSWGYEDDEIIIRAGILGYPVVRPKQYFSCYHFTHYRGVNSSSLNPYCIHNKNEFEKIKKMSRDELINYKIC